MTPITTGWPGYHWLVSRWPDDGLWHWTAYRRLAVDSDDASQARGTAATQDAAITAAKAAIA